jgi:hypothetical protein
MKGHVGLGKESAWGTAVAATDYMKAMSEDVQLRVDRFDIVNIHGSVTEPDDADGVQNVNGSIAIPGHPVSIGHILTGLLGAPSVNSLHTSLWRHDFQAQEVDTSTAAPLPSFTFEMFRDVTTAQRYSGCVISGGTFGISPNNTLGVSVDIIGKAATEIAQTTPSFPSPTGNFDFKTASVQIGGSATPLVEELSITIDNALEGVPALTAEAAIAKIKRAGPVLTNISGRMSFDDLTEYLNFKNQTEQSFEVSMFLANSYSIVFDVPRMIYTSWDASIPGRERLTAAFEGKARYHTGSASALQVRLTTDKSDF